MFDEIILTLIKQISNEGLDKEITKILIDVIDTILAIEDYDKINIANIQTLLLLLQDFEVDPIARRFVEELRYKIIRKSIDAGKKDVAMNYTTTVMNRDIVEKVYDVSVLTNGKMELKTTYSIQPTSISKDELVLNDLGCLALSTSVEDDMILAVERFEIPRTGCCGVIRTDMIYPIGKECGEDSFKKEALCMAMNYTIGSDERVADTYSIEYFSGKPNQNFRQSGKSLFLLELDKDSWCYYKDGVRVFTKTLEELREVWS